MSTIAVANSARGVTSPTRLLLLVALGSIIAVLGVFSDPAAGYGALLVAAQFGVSIAIGAAILLALNGVAGARWHGPVANLALAIAASLAIPLVALAIAIGPGLTVLYPWARPEVVAASHVLMAKSAWLTYDRFWLRAVIVAVAWMALVAAMRAPLARFVSGERTAMRQVSALFLVVLAPTISIASWDWTMSLEPTWFSTMWAVYRFAGAFCAGLATVTIASVYFSGPRAVSDQNPATAHRDLGRMLFGFASFWAYIWFCQYMLIWYANLPEETTWYASRLNPDWSMLFWLNPILNWVLPFGFLLSARAKRDPATLVQVSLVVLAGQWLDTYLAVAPSLSPRPLNPLVAVAATVAVVAGMFLMTRRRLTVLDGRKAGTTGATPMTRAAASRF